MCRTLLTLRGLLEASIFCRLDYSKLFGIFCFSSLFLFSPHCKCMTAEVPPCVCCLESKRTNPSNLYFVTVVAVDTIAVGFGEKKPNQNKRRTVTSLILPLHRRAPVTLRQCSASKAKDVFFFLLAEVSLSTEGAEHCINT